MFWVRFWSFVMGYLTLMVEGKSVEKLVNMAVSRGIYLWDIHWLGPDKVMLRARVSSFKALRHIVKRAGGRLKISEKRGLPFKTAKMMRRQMMVVGALVCITLLYIMSSFVWFVEVTGNEKVTTKAILEKAEEAGLYTGTAKWKLEPGDVEQQIKNELPGLSWVGVSITGTKARIKVAEKVEAPVTDDTPANIVAQKAGLVDEILVLSGTAAAKEGEMVEKGDVLISGVIKTELDAPVQDTSQGEEEKPEKIIKTKFVRAKGIIKARVWYESYGESPLKFENQVKTGNYCRDVDIKIGKNLYTLYTSDTQPYKRYIKVVQVKRLPQWRNIKFPVELVTTYYYETKTVKEQLSFAEAKAKALEKAESQLQKVMPAKAKVKRRKVSFLNTKEPNLIRVKLIIETQEDLGVVQPLSKEEMNPDFYQKNQEVNIN